MYLSGHDVKTPLTLLIRNEPRQRSGISLIPFLSVTSNAPVNNVTMQKQHIPYHARKQKKQDKQTNYRGAARQVSR